MGRKPLAALLAACVLAGTLVTVTSATGTLAQRARWLASHGGVLSTRYGDATVRMKAMSRQLVVQRFRIAGSDAVRWALCVADRESGFNPGAVNSTAIAPDYPVPGAGHASGLFQFVTYYHRWVDRWRMLHDPAYAVEAAYRLSRGGRDRSPWAGGGYRC